VQKRLWWNWEHDRLAYPNWESFVRRLRDEFDIRVMSYINPFLTDVETGGKAPGSWTRNYFREAKAQGYLVKRWVRHGAPSDPLSKAAEQDEPEWRQEDALISSGPGLVAGMIDLTNPAAVTWYKQLIKDNMLRYGVSGWMVCIQGVKQLLHR
jgi:alpha-glucosidase (family GH31 glycosyl hydrolase)